MFYFERKRKVKCVRIFDVLIEVFGKVFNFKKKYKKVKKQNEVSFWWERIKEESFYLCYYIKGFINFVIYIVC